MIKFSLFVYAHIPVGCFEEHSLSLACHKGCKSENKHNSHVHCPKTYVANSALSHCLYHYSLAGKPLHGSLPNMGTRQDPVWVGLAGLLYISTEPVINESIYHSTVMHIQLSIYTIHAVHVNVSFNESYFVLCMFA